ncbi:MAG: hypothetical protein WBX27_16410 [Specibacter sp.]
MKQLRLQEVWDGLSTETKGWFQQNPGCRALPRTLVNIIRESYRGPIALDQDGIMALSPDDLKFLQSTPLSAGRPLSDEKYPGETK